MRLLQTLARKLEHMENPSRLNADRLAEMKSDLDFKQMQMGNSASTSERLGQELERRKQGLQKIDTLDEKISGELRQLAERMVRARAPRALAAARRARMRACAPTSTRRPPRTSRSQASMSEKKKNTYRDLKSLNRGLAAAASCGPRAGHRPLRRTEGGGAAREGRGRRAQQPAHSRRPRRRASTSSSRCTRAPPPRAAPARAAPCPRARSSPPRLPPRRCGRTKMILLVVRLHHRAVARDEVPARRGRLRALCAHSERRRWCADSRQRSADGLRRRLVRIARASCTQCALWLRAGSGEELSR